MIGFSAWIQTTSDLQRAFQQFRKFMETPALRQCRRRKKTCKAHSLMCFGICFSICLPDVRCTFPRDLKNTSQKNWFMAALCVANIMPLYNYFAPAFAIPEKQRNETEKLWTSLKILPFIKWTILFKCFNRWRTTNFLSHSDAHPSSSSSNSSQRRSNHLKHCANL